MFELNDIIDVILTGKKIATSPGGENLILNLPDGRSREFEIYAGIFHGGKFYFITHPVLPMQDLDEDEGLVFNLIADDKETSRFLLVDNEETIEKVFDEYYKLFDEE